MDLAPDPHRATRPSPGVTTSCPTSGHGSASAVAPAGRHVHPPRAGRGGRAPASGRAAPRLRGGELRRARRRASIRAAPGRSTRCRWSSPARTGPRSSGVWRSGPGSSTPSLEDVYGRQSLLRDGIVPAEVGARGRGPYRPACQRCRPCIRAPARGLRRRRRSRRHGQTASCCATTPTRPSGAGYALLNRTLLARLFPDAYRDLGVQRLAEYFAALRAGVGGAGARRAGEPASRGADARRRSSQLLRALLPRQLPRLQPRRGRRPGRAGRPGVVAGAVGPGGGRHRAAAGRGRRRRSPRARARRRGRGARPAWRRPASAASGWPTRLGSAIAASRWPPALPPDACEHLLGERLGWRRWRRIGAATPSSAPRRRRARPHGAARHDHAHAALVGVRARPRRRRRPQVARAHPASSRTATSPRRSRGSPRRPSCARA